MTLVTNMFHDGDVVHPAHRGRYSPSSVARGVQRGNVHELWRRRRRRNLAVVVERWIEQRIDGVEREQLGRLRLGWSVSSVGELVGRTLE
jgi:hypothetical protein